MMRTSDTISITSVTLLSCLMLATARAQDGSDGSNTTQNPGLTTDIRDPEVQLRAIRQRRGIPTYSLFPTSPLTPLRERTHELEGRLYEATDIKFGTVFNTLLQGLSDEIPGEDDFGMATAMSFLGTWDACNQGCPNQGQVTFELQGRWDWGTTAPADLGPGSLGSLTFTANQFGGYTPTFLVRNLYWRKGGREVGSPWVYRIGRITPDALLGTSTHINGFTTFLPVAGTGPFSMGLPDSGLGWVGGWFINDWLTVAGLISDSNADLLGAAYNWVQPTGVPRDESNVELFYRFPLFPYVDVTFSYQAIINPALDPSNDYGSAFSFRFRSLW